MVIKLVDNVLTFSNCTEQDKTDILFWVNTGKNMQISFTWENNEQEKVLDNGSFYGTKKI